MKRTEHTQKWLDALRSGEYKQGRECLFDSKGYCCLGVAGKLVDFPVHLDSLEVYEHIGKLYGLDELDRCKLAIMNDYQSKTFPEIADAIEQMLDGN